EAGCPTHQIRSHQVEALVCRLVQLEARGRSVGGWVGGPHGRLRPHQAVAAGFGDLLLAPQRTSESWRWLNIRWFRRWTTPCFRHGAQFAKPRWISFEHAEKVVHERIRCEAQEGWLQESRRVAVGTRLAPER